MKTFIFSLLIFCSFYSQGQLLQDIHGRPYLTKPYEEYDGTPFLFKDWVDAKVISSDGKAYDSMLINIDIYQNRLVFIREKLVYTFAEDDITELSVIEGEKKRNFKKGKIMDKTLPDLFYEVLDTQPLLLKNTTRKLVDAPSYGGANKKYRFAEGKEFYASVNGTVQKISLNKSDAEKVFADKWKAVNDYAAQNKISFKTEEGWQSVCNYFKTL